MHWCPSLAQLSWYQFLTLSQLVQCLLPPNLHPTESGRVAWEDWKSGKQLATSNEQQQQQDLIAASYVTRLQLEECPCMYSKPHSGSWLTTLCCWRHMHGSHSKSSFPDGLRAGFASHLLALRAILLLAELWTHSLTRCCWID